MTFHPQERIGLFIDGSNLYAAAQALGFDIDYKRLLEYFAAKGYLICAFYYTALLRTVNIRPSGPWSIGWTTTAIPWSPSRPRSSPTPPDGGKLKGTWISNSPST